MVGIILDSIFHDLRKKKLSLLELGNSSIGNGFYYVGTYRPEMRVLSIGLCKRRSG